MGGTFCTWCCMREGKNSKKNPPCHHPPLLEFHRSYGEQNMENIVLKKILIDIKFKSDFSYKMPHKIELT